MALMTVEGLVVASVVGKAVHLAGCWVDMMAD